MSKLTSLAVKVQPGTTLEQAQAELAELKELKAELAKAKAENERLRASKIRALSIKVSEKGGVSVYGLGRFPVTLYKQQWERLLSMSEEINTFIQDHAAELSVKE